MADMTAELLSELIAELRSIGPYLRANTDCAKRASYTPINAAIIRVEAVATQLARLSGMAAVPDGWKLVPVNATDEMLQAWHEGSLAAEPDGDYHGTPTISLDAINRAGYAALLAAAPEVPGHG